MKIVLPALLAVAFAGVAHRLDAPVLYTGIPSIDLGQLSSILASVAAALYSVAQVVTALRDFVEKWRNPSPAPALDLASAEDWARHHPAVLTHPSGVQRPASLRAGAGHELDPTAPCDHPGCPRHPQP